MIIDNIHVFLINGDTEQLIIISADTGWYNNSKSYEVDVNNQSSYIK